jgi:hypothetical protein
MSSLLVLMALCLAAESPENIAKGATYTLQPAPNYAYCTDPGDTQQLTDGVYTQGHFWTQPSTVGWSGVGRAIVTLDLGRVQAIRGVSYNTAAGVAGVAWPSAIRILTADEDKAFHEVGELVSLSARREAAPQDGYALHRFWTDELQCHGRYVALVVQSDAFIFCDEIEVYAGAPEWVQQPLPGPVFTDLTAYMTELTLRNGIQRRLELDAAALRKNVTAAAIPDAERTRCLETVEAVEKAAQQTEAAPQIEAAPPGFKAILPLNETHAALFRAQAAYWRAVGLPAWTVWSPELWDTSTPTSAPPRDAVPAVRVHMMNNEYRAAALNLSNATEKDADAEVRIMGLPGSPAPDWIAVHAVPWTDTQRNTPVQAALPLADRAGDGYRIHAHAGLTAQVWFTFHPADLAPGLYSGAVQVRMGGAAVEAPLTLKIYPMRFPDRPRLHFGGWDYSDAAKMYDMTEQNRAALVAMLQEHYVDSPWGTSAVLTFGQYDATGAMTTPPDTARFEAWIQRWPNAAQYCVFPAVTASIGALKMGAPEFDRAVGEWAVFWAQHVKEKGLRPEQFALLLVDETSSPEQDAIIIAWANTIHAAKTGLRVWEDPTYQDMSTADPNLGPVCDALCPNRPLFLTKDAAYRDWYAQQRKRGAALEFYSCSGPVRNFDPYLYYRVQAWQCWRYGATATYFWAFGDGAGGSSWNEYLLPRATFTPVFLDATSVTGGKHLEAAREGVEDYEYLAMLQEAMRAAQAKCISDPNIARAQHLLDEAPEQVCASDSGQNYNWSNDAVDRGAADKIRIEILETLAALSSLSEK